MSFSHQHLMMVFHWSLNINSFKVSWKTLSILAEPIIPIVYSKSPSRCTIILVTVSSVPLTVGITVTFMIHSVICFLAISNFLSFFSLSFNLPFGQPE